MGYYTDYYLYVDGNIDDEEELERAISEQFGDVFEDVGVDQSWGFAKWYDHDTDMAKFSTQFPNVTFYLEGYGDDRDDIWGHYFQNGRIQREIIEVHRNAFDPEKLEPIGGVSPVSESVGKPLDEQQLEQLLLV